MATANRKQDSYINDLSKCPEKYEFFQSVRLLQKAIQEKNQFSLNSREKKKNENTLSHLRFKTASSFSFPKSSIYSIVANDEESKTQKYFFEITVNFIGLTGINGVLPDHYTKLIINQQRTHDYALQAFFDIFNHRCITLFYHSWEKYHFPFIVSESASTQRKKKNFTNFIESIYGNGSPYLRNRLHISEKALCYYAGLFSREVRSAVDLESILNDYTLLPIKIKELQPEYLYVQEQDQTRIGYQTRGQYNQLGKGALLGSKIISISNKFRVIVGPLSYDEFQKFLPPQRSLFEIFDLVKFYVGSQYSFDLQFILNKEEVPFCELSLKTPVRLGWDTWIGAEIPQFDPDDTVLSSDLINRLALNNNEHIKYQN